MDIYPGGDEWRYGNGGDDNTAAYHKPGKLMAGIQNRLLYMAYRREVVNGATETCRKAAGGNTSATTSDTQPKSQVEHKFFTIAVTSWAVGVLTMAAGWFLLTLAAVLVHTCAVCTIIASMSLDGPYD